MKQFKRKSEQFSAMTFDDMINVALNKDETHIVNGIPWSFKIKGYHFSHENDDCYIITNGSEVHVMNRNMVLAFGPKNNIVTHNEKDFKKVYEQVKETE